MDKLEMLLPYNIDIQILDDMKRLPNLIMPEKSGVHWAFTSNIEKSDEDLIWDTLSENDPFRVNVNEVIDGIEKHIKPHLK